MDRWPALPFAEWEPTCLTLHRFTQVVGKVQLALAPWMNHWWHVSLRVVPQGLVTGTLCGDRHLSVTFDLRAHRLIAQTSESEPRSFALEPMTVATFYERTMTLLGSLDV